MYNMEISIGSYKLRVEIMVAIVVVFWVMFGHLLCSCCKMSLFEGATTMNWKARRAKRGMIQDQIDKLRQELKNLE